MPKIKKRYVWFCSWDKGNGKNRCECKAGSRKKCKDKEDAIRLAKFHANKYGHDTIYVIEQDYESRTSDKKRHWYNSKAEYVGNKSIRTYNNILYNYSWATFDYLDYEFAIILKDKIQPNSRVLLDNDDWHDIKIMSNRQIYDFCRSKYKYRYAFFNGMVYKNTDELKKDMLLCWLGGI